MPSLRTSERLLLAYFAYVAVVAILMLPQPRPAIGIALAVAVVVPVLARTQSPVRDFAPLAFTLLAYREMDLFKVLPHTHRLESTWVQWDRQLLAWLRPALESLGPVLPFYLEFCYLCVYAVSIAAVCILLRNRRRAELDTLWLAYLAGTLGAYALFPYFPSDPPRTVFPGLDNPNIFTLPRQLNLGIVNGAGIHSSVFPSAHVSSAFAAAWGLRAAIPGKPWIARTFAIYAISVAIATIYGRYHYAADAAAGIAISLIAIPLVAAKRTIPS